MAAGVDMKKCASVKLTHFFSVISYLLNLYHA